jgi:hypothetical protein
VQSSQSAYLPVTNQFPADVPDRKDFEAFACVLFSTGACLVGWRQDLDAGDQRRCQPGNADIRNAMCRGWLVVVRRRQHHSPRTQNSVLGAYARRQLAGNLGTQIGMNRHPKIPFQIGIHSGKGIGHLRTSGQENEHPMHCGVCHLRGQGDGPMSLIGSYRSICQFRIRHGILAFLMLRYAS